MIEPVTEHVIVRAEDERTKEVDRRRGFVVDRRDEVRWHDANDFMIGAVQLDAASRGSGVAAEQPSPGRVGEDRHAMASPAEVVRRECATDDGSQAEDVEIPETDVLDVEAFGASRPVSVIAPCSNAIMAEKERARA